MAHFYVSAEGSRGGASRLGTKTSGVVATAASWKGAIEVRLFVNTSGQDAFRITQRTWKGAGIDEVLAEGVIGEPTSK